MKDKALKLAAQSIKDLMHALIEGRMAGDDYMPVELEAFSVLDAIEAALAQPAQEPNKISTEELVYMTGVYDGKVLEREACAKVLESISNAPDMQSYAAVIRAREYK